MQKLLKATLKILIFTGIILIIKQLSANGNFINATQTLIFNGILPWSEYRLSLFETVFYGGLISLILIRYAQHSVNRHINYSATKLQNNKERTTKPAKKLQSFSVWQNRLSPKLKLVNKKLANVFSLEQFTQRFSIRRKQASKSL